MERGAGRVPIGADGPLVLRSPSAQGSSGPPVPWDPSALIPAIYQTVPQSTVVVDAYNHLRQAIVLFLLPAGSKLPTEPVLAKRLGVGVVTMRASLSMLRDEGFIVTTRGRTGGSWVADDDAIVEASMRLTCFSIAELQNTIDLLIALETQAMGLAALRATATERAEIRELAAYPREGTPSREWQRHANVLHLRIAHAAHNPELAAAVRASRARLQELRTAGAGSVVFCVQSGQFHDLVVESIVRGDDLQARRVCFTFMTNCWDCILRVIEYRATCDGYALTAVDGRLGAVRYAPDGRAAAGPSGDAAIRLAGRHGDARS